MVFSAPMNVGEPHESGRARDFWDREVVTPSHVSWMEEVEVRQAINRRIGGSDGTWPLDWFMAAYPGRRFARALSIGAGTGALERDLIRRDLCDVVDAFDGSPGSLSIARSESVRMGFDRRIRYFAADFNRILLPRRHYDIVLIHQALHHVARIEGLYRQIIRALRPGGLFYLDEYVGPSRTDWSAWLHRYHQAIYQTIPREARAGEHLPLPIQADDPSEALRSSEIVELLRVGFDLSHQRDYGGNLLAVLYPSVDWQQAPSGLLQRLLHSEDKLMEAGEPSYHTVIVARPKKGWRAAYAKAWYFLKPKWRRIRLEFWRKLGKTRPF
jgi:SAM-dependent methyltransferase